jgi:hypothetical protein
VHIFRDCYLVARLNNALSGKSCGVFQIIRVTRAAGLLLGLKRAIFNAAASQNVREMCFHRVARRWHALCEATSRMALQTTPIENSEGH